MRVLILGGTIEASMLARALAGDARFAPTLSLAGRTRAPRPPPIPWRIGGFGGVAGLAAHLRAERVAALIDATHPFAAQMSGHAAQAAELARIPLLRVDRPPWQPGPGDAWIMAPDMRAAVAALGRRPRRVFLTIGQRDLAVFRAAPWHCYVVRSVDPPEPAARPPNADVIAARGPFDEAAEAALLRKYGIEILVTKNSGGDATSAKLRAACALCLPVVMVERPPPLPGIETVASPQAALDWLERLHAGPVPRHGGVQGAVRRGV